MNDTMNAAEGISAGLIARHDIPEGMEVIGIYTVEHVRGGEVIGREDFPNLVTTQGKNDILDKYLGLGTAHAAVRLGLHTTVGNASSTYAAPTPQVESTVSSRVAPTFGAAASGSKATSSAASFSITGTATITGAFCALGPAGIGTAGDTAASGAVLLSTGSFASSRSVINGDTLNVTYTLSI